MHWVQASILMYLKKEKAAYQSVDAGQKLLGQVELKTTRLEIIYATYHMALAIRTSDSVKGIEIVVVL